MVVVHQEASFRLLVILLLISMEVDLLYVCVGVFVKTLKGYGRDTLGNFPDLDLSSFFQRHYS